MLVDPLNLPFATWLREQLDERLPEPSELSTTRGIMAAIAMAANGTPIPARWVEAYYLATPVFAVADWLGANVRAVGLADHPGWRVAYYAACTIAGATLHLRPRWAAAIGLGEASVNVLLLVLGVFLPYFEAVASVTAGGSSIALPFGAGFLANFLISGAVWTAIFQRHVRALGGDPHR